MRLFGRTEQFGTRITRRVVMLFMAGALLPVAATLLLAYDGVQSALLAERTALLRGIAAQYGDTLVDRLQFSETMARAALSQVAAKGDARGAAFEGYFRAAMTLDAAGEQEYFGGPVPASPTGRTLLVVPGRGGPPAIWLVVRDQDAGPRRMAVELDQKFLWGSIDDLPYLTDVCVVGPGSVPLFCSRPISQAAFRLSRGDSTWEEGGERFLAGSSEIFLRGRYGADSWTVVVAQPEAHALAPVRAVQNIVFPVMALGLLLAALLGLIQVRRTLGPLKELSDATARIAVQDFSLRVGVERDDEFGALARAFNAMAERLRRQFAALRAHSEVDAVILSGVAIPRVAEIVLQRVAELVSAQRQYLLLAEPGEVGQYRLYFLTTEAGRAGVPVVVAPQEADLLLAAPSGWDFARRGAARPEFLASIPGRIFVLPIALGDELAGAMVLEYQEERVGAGEEVALLSRLGNRVAVALGTAARDLELQRRAHYDALTKLPNRVLGMEELTRALSSAARHRRSLAVLFVDLDGFSDVNDSLGHEAGDRLLAETAERLRSCVRKSDIVARLGGDEFAVMLTEVRLPADASVVARHIIETLSHRYELGGSSAFVSATVGIAVHPEDGATAEELLRNADLAMYDAKQRGRGQASFYKASMNQQVQQRVEVERELRQALAAGQFELHYQPQVEVVSGRIVGAEALLRWNHPVRGRVPPAQFIAYAEASGLIEPLGEWVLQAACAQFAAWRAADVPLAHMSVNVSPRQFRKADLAASVRAALERHAMAPADLNLEITESALLDDETAANSALRRLHEVGTNLELDDFGTGYSSLGRLQRLPVAGVKLDQGFIAPMEDNEAAQAVVRAAIDMAHALGMYVVAEGVERAGHLALLTQMGCDLVQGYHVSVPLPAERFAELVLERAGARGTPGVVRSIRS